jgi:hypothetical protein
MGVKSNWEARSANPATVTYAGRFSDTPAVVAGYGWSVAANGSDANGGTMTGDYTITFSQKHPALLAFVAGVSDSDQSVDDDWSVTVEDIVTSGTANTVVVQVCKNGSNAALDSNSQVHFIAVFQNSTLPDH